VAGNRTTIGESQWRMAFAAAITLALAFPLEPPARASDSSRDPLHFIFFDRARDRIAETSFLESTAIAGAQLKYTWRELEPERDRYDIAMVLADLAFLQKHGKSLFVQLQDVSFDETVNVPEYLRTDPAFGGGVARKYLGEGDDESKAGFDGWVARRWDPAVRSRFAKLLQALGRELNGKIEGLVLAETALGFGDHERFHPAGYTNEAYVEGVKANMLAAREAFPLSRVIQYANFMPGEWLPEDDHGFLRAVYEHAYRIGVGVGGPDLIPHRKGQLKHSYPLIASRPQGVVAGVAVQSGNLEEMNPATREPVTVSEVYRFAKDPLRLNYVFWGTQEPYYSAHVLPFLRKLPRSDEK